MVSTGEKLFAHNIWLEMTDSCNEAILAAKQPIGEIKVKGLTPGKVTKGY